jgi:hypothetical protein
MIIIYYRLHIPTKTLDKIEIDREELLRINGMSRYFNEYSLINAWNRLGEDTWKYWI